MMILKSTLLFALPLLGFAAPSIFVPATDLSKHQHFAPKDGAVPRGKITKINGVDTYVTLPRGHFKKDTAVLFLTDVFGLPAVANKLVADEYADAGYATYAPDYLNGDAITDVADLPAWIENHGEAQTTPTLLAALEGLRKRGITKFATTGYCFGGLYTTRLAQNNTITVGSISHPSLLTVPDDFELLLSNSTIPLHINSAEHDDSFPPPVAAEVDDVLGGGAYEPGYARTDFKGVGHGFAVQYDPEDPVQVEAKKGSLKATLKFFRKHL